MRYLSLVALAHDWAGIAEAPAETAEKPSVEVAALAQTDYVLQPTEAEEPQVEMFPLKAEYPPQEQAVIERALKILESRLRTEPGPHISSPEAAIEYFRLKMAAEPAEVFMAAFLDTRHRLIEIREMFRGTIDGAAVYPREIIRAVYETNAAAVLFSHAHPSGVAEPSEADRGITLKLSRALALIDVRVLDHVVIGGMEHVSLAERGWI